MNKLKHFFLIVMRGVKQIALLPRTIANAVKLRQRRAVMNDNEAERLDRIRNPSKYLGM